MGVNPNRKIRSGVSRESASYWAAAVRLADVAEEHLEGQWKIHTYFSAHGSDTTLETILVPFPRKQPWQLCHGCRQGSDATRRHYLSNSNCTTTSIVLIYLEFPLNFPCKRFFLFTIIVCIYSWYHIDNQYLFTFEIGRTGITTVFLLIILFLLTV